MRILTLSILAAAWLVPTQPEAAKKELAKLEGTWKLTAMEVAGKPVAEGRLTSATLTIRGNKYTLVSGNRQSEVELTLDPGKTPKEIDMQVLDGPNKDRVGKGIYELDGDKLKICRSLDPQDERPKEFKTEGMVNYFTMIWQRQP